MKRTKDAWEIFCISVAVIIMVGGFIFGAYRTTHVVKVPQMGVGEYVDPDTKVHYLYRDDGGMTVRYNTDGTIMIGNSNE